MLIHLRRKQWTFNTSIDKDIERVEVEFPYSANAIQNDFDHGEAMRDWLNEHCVGRWIKKYGVPPKSRSNNWQGPITMFFDNADDAMVFKLTFI